jgi:neutral amino acid transport system permease protein
MEVILSRPSTRLGRGWAYLMAALALASSALVISAPAQAATPSHTSVSTSTHIKSSDPSTWQYSIAGSLKLNRKPVKGVTITATLGSFSGKAVSDAFGEWNIMVPKAGVYTVAIDQATLPSGFTVTNPSMQADLTETTFAAVLFKFGGQTTSTVDIGSQLVGRIFAGLNFGLLLALAAIGISLIFGTTGLTNFAHGEIVTLGALMMWLLHAALGWPIVLAAVAAMAVSGAFGWLQDAFLWKPLRKRRMGLNQMMIVSIGFSIVMRYIYLLTFNGDTKDIAGGGQVIKLGPINTTDVTLWGMLIAIVGLLGVALFLTRTRVGKATRAVSDNAALASATGIDVESIIRIVWLTASILTGLAGLIYGLEFQANWLTGSDIQLLLFAAVTLGGLGTAFGAAVGALIIGLTVEISTVFIPNELRYAVALVILIVVLIVRPQGVLGKKQRLG